MFVIDVDNGVIRISNEKICWGYNENLTIENVVVSQVYQLFMTDSIWPDFRSSCVQPSDFSSYCMP